MKAFIALIAIAAVGGPTDGAERPNLVVIQTDEHNFRTLGCYRALLPAGQAFVWGEGVAVETPNLDWLAEHGAICDRYYATSPVCTPSRAALVSGLYPQNTGAIRNDLPMRDDIVTYAEVLRRVGYATGYAGKWHLDGPGKPQWGPDRHFGFEDNRFLFNRGHWKKLVRTPEGPRVGSTGPDGVPNYGLDGADASTFSTDFLADRAVDFIREHQGGPFCYHVSIPDPHGPNTVRAPYDTMFDALPFRQPASARTGGTGLPGYAATLPDDFNARQMSLYFGMVKCVDDNVGKILGALREAGVLEKSFIVFTSDHGDLCGEHGRHNKGVPMETSARIPFLLFAPGVVEPGTRVEQALGTVDFKPTILALMGIDDPTRTEGRDASALFRGRDGDPNWVDRTFVRIGGEGGSGGWMGVFSRRYKLIVAADDGPALFDLETDPDELTNRFASPESREIARALAKALRDYAQSHHDPLLQSASLRADLAWAIEGEGAYRPSIRPAPAKAKAKAKAKTKAKAKRAGDDDDAG